MATLSPELRRLLPLALSWALGLSLALVAWQFHHTQAPLGVDSHAYWSAFRGPMYDHAPDTRDAFLYSPAFAQALWPLAQLPWPVFGVLWSSLSVLGLVRLLRPLGWRWVVPILLLCAPEILSGNIFWLLALVAANGLRHPSLWAVPLLTKVTPALGPLWFATRREWQPLLVSSCASAAAVLVSWTLDPDLWHQWLTFLLDHASQARSRETGSSTLPPLTLRLPLAVLLTIWAARTDRPWGLPAAMVLATPVSGIAALTMLTALARLSPCPAAPSTLPGSRSCCAGCCW